MGISLIALSAIGSLNYIYFCAENDINCDHEINIMWPGAAGRNTWKRYVKRKVQTSTNIAMSTTGGANFPFQKVSVIHT